MEAYILDSVLIPHRLARICQNPSDASLEWRIHAAWLEDFGT